MSLKDTSAKKLRKEKAKWNIDSGEEYNKKEEEFYKKRKSNKEPTIKGFVRITARKVKNFQIAIPRATRPLTDRMKVQLFDTIGSEIRKKTVLDLYAGSGSFGLEALSRGASECTFVDAAKHAEKVLIENIKKTGFLTEALVIKEKAEDFLSSMSQSNEMFDIIFIDPPYKFYNSKDLRKMQHIIGMAASLLPGVKNPDIKGFKGVLILKHPTKYPLEKLELEGLKVFRTTIFGKNALTTYIVAK